MIPDPDPLPPTAAPISSALDELHLPHRFRAWSGSQFEDDSDNLWKLALEGSGAGAWDWNLITGEQIHSQRWQQMLGYEVGEIADANHEFVSRVHPDDLPHVSAAFTDYLQGRIPSYAADLRLRCKDGHWKWIHTRGTVVSRNAQGQPLRMIGTHTDITDRKAAEIALRDSEERWKLALESTGDGVWDWHIASGREYFSKRLVEMYGFTEDELADRPEELDQRTHPDDVEAMQRDRQAHFDGMTPTYSNEHRVRCKDGSWKWVHTRGMVISRDANGTPARMIGTHTDITDRKNAEAQVRQHAYFDPLTGLPNRRMLRDRLEQEIKRSRRDGLQLAILFIDLDHFKEVNDTLGHDNGDLLLVEAARRLRQCVRECDTVARMGGDEFTVLLTELAPDTHLEQLLHKLLQTMAQVFQLGQEQVFVSASVGVTLYPADGTELEALYKNADQALYVAKGAGRNRFSFFTPALQEAALTRARLTNDLRHAVGQQQLQLLYQPIVALASGAVHKAEALLRWRHPERGLISPAAFIPMAETSGLIVPMGDWVFEQAALQVQAWRRSLAPTFQISINTSPVQFQHTQLPDANWVRRLAAMGLPGDSLSIEITEGVLLDSNDGVTAKLLEWRDAGLQVALDDFGTGYSSLSYLLKFDIDFIKIDQSFVRDLQPGSTNFTLCKAMVAMAHALGLQVVAEGVETAQQRDLLIDAGCDYAQGYFFARPMTAPALAEWVTQQAPA
ncbi:MAG TPA: GGDEF domain-containing protein [Rhodoferax sp.]|uniref:putative bifunctional diguanylate cyclase/phosphodiesterase n=1 Tax=Rhodoferax sp. TaxID=50421 RepID=UPI000A9B04F6|nr:GGDEF domain-containing phosphodiesterase [Rhodoferax sp.]HCX81459.1 GGDEF domain-containing protein [Rhodoferax sp.]